MKTKCLIAILIMFFSSNHQMQAQSSQEKKILVAYFSHTGNTGEIAKQIQKATSADLFEIRPVDAYPTDYQTLIEQAKKEINANYKPALKSKVENINTYDVIFVGSPNWWGTIAPPVATFLSTYSLSEKTIVPFITHGGSSMGQSVSDIKKLCPKSVILDGFPVKGSSVKNAKNDILTWLRKIGMNTYRENIK